MFCVNFAFTNCILHHNCEDEFKKKKKFSAKKSKASNIMEKHNTVDSLQKISFTAEAVVTLC